MPTAVRPPPLPSHLPTPPPYRSVVHFIPPAYQTASTAPFAFTLLYRYPPHYEAEDNPQYANQPLQFLLKLAQPSSQHASGYAVYEVVLSGQLSVAELERVLVSNMHWLASVQLAVKGKIVPQSAAVQTLYDSQRGDAHTAAQRTASSPGGAETSVAPRALQSSSPCTLAVSLCLSAESNISLVLHPHHSSAYSVPVNGGLPLSRGVLSYLQRHRIVYLSAAVLVVTIIMQATEEKPTRHTDGGSGSVEDERAQEHWRQRVQQADDTIRDIFVTKPEDGKK